MRVTFASNRPIERWFGKLTFRVDENSITGERLRAGVVSFLKDHNRTQPVGKPNGTFTILGGSRRKRADINIDMATTPTATETKDEIDQGIRNGISFGYDIYEMEVVQEADYSRGIEAHYEATKWDFWEISSVTVPANMDAKVRGRASAGSNDSILTGYAAFDSTDTDPEDDGAQFTLGLPYTEMTRQSEALLIAQAHERHTQKLMNQGKAGKTEEQEQKNLDGDGAEGNAGEGNPAEPPTENPGGPSGEHPTEEAPEGTEHALNEDGDRTEGEQTEETPSSEESEGTSEGDQQESTESEESEGTEQGPTEAAPSAPESQSSSSEPTEQTQHGDDAMPDGDGNTTTQTPEEVRAAQVKVDVARIMELAEFGNTDIHRQAAYNAIRDGKTLEEYKAQVTEELKSVQFQAGTISGKAKEQAKHGNTYDLGDVTGYVLANNKGRTAQEGVAYAIAISDKLLNSGMAEINGELKNIGMPNKEQVSGLMSENGMIIPHAVMSGEANLVSSTNVSGEIAIEVDESRYLDWLREPSRILKYCDVIRDVTSDFRIPVGSGSGPQVTYIAETGTPTATTATWRTVAPEPHALLGTMDYTELSNIRTGGFVSRRLGEGFGAALANMVDGAIVVGDGTGANPTGLNAAATTTTAEENKVNSVAIASSGITWAKVVELEGAVKRNGPFTNYIYVVANNIYGNMRTTPRAAGQGGFIINDVNQEMKTGAIDGTPVLMSDHMPTKRLLYGPFDQCVVPFWGFIVTGNYRNPANPLQNKIFILQYHDVVFRRLDLFAKGVQA